MDAEAYFPADISDVPHEEESVTETITTEEEKNSVTILPTAAKRLMYGRKRRDPPLFPSTIQELPSMARIIPADTSIFCLLCLNKISGCVANFLKPCHCPLVFVHTTCAIDNETFFGGTCSQCHEMYRPEHTTPRHSLSPTKSPPGRQSLMSKKTWTSSQNVLENDNLCALCQNQKYQNPEWSQLNNAKLIRPCFCGFLVHHGCIADHLKQEKGCEWCGVKYRYYRYGSVCDFCRKYSIQHVCYLLVFTFLFSFFVFALRGSYVFRPTAEFSPIVLTILAFIFFSAFLGTFLFSIKHTVMTRWPRFRRRYGKITVVTYDPNIRSKKEVLRSLKAGRNESLNELNAVPLNTIAQVESQESALETTRTIQCDLSLGQQMFGVATNPRVFASTPMMQNPKVTVFASSEA